MTGINVRRNVQEPPRKPETPHRTRRPPAPLLLPAAALAGGIAFDNAVGTGTVSYLFGMFLGLLLLVWPFGRRECVKVIVVLLAFCVGGFSHHRQMHSLPADHLLRYTRATPVLARVTGTVITRPSLPRKRFHVFSPWWPSGGRTSFLADVDGLETTGGPAAASGTIKVSVKEPIMTLAVGDRVELFGWCYRLRAPRNPGQFDWARYNRRRGVFVGITCSRRECVRELESEGNTATALWDRVRQRVRAGLLEEMLAGGGPETTLLDTMVLGRRGAIEPQLNEAFIRIGCAHYLAVSGMHVGMLGLFVWFVGRGCGVRVRGCAAAVIVITVFYASIADPRPPILRATVMTAAVCTGLLAGRPANFLNGLSLAALVILVLRPAQLFDAGFQFSFSAVLAIVYLSPKLMDRLHRLRPFVIRTPDDDEIDLFVEPPSASAVIRAWRWLELRCWWMLTASTAAWLVCAPLALIHFSRFSPWGWLTSTLLFPFVFVLMVASFAKLLCAMLLPTMASLLTAPVQGLASVLIGAVESLKHLPALSSGLGTVPVGLAAAYYATLIAWAVQHRRRYGKRVTGVLVCLTVICLAGWLAPARGDGRLTMTVLSVGRGTSVVLELPDGRVILYDAGASGSYDPGRSVIVPFLRHRGIRGVDAVLISHPNLDHFAGMPTVIECIRTGPAYVTPYFEPLSTSGMPSRVLLDELRAADHPLAIVDRDSDPLVFGDVTLEFLWPAPDLGTEIANNETSLVVRVSYAGRSILLTGDIEALAQGRLLADADLRADVLLMPHHGSLRHNTRDFVEAVAPEVLISSTFVRSAEHDIEFDDIIGGRRHFNTADNGAVTVSINREGVRVWALSETR